MVAVSVRALVLGLVCLLTWGHALAKDAKEVLQTIFPNQSITELQKLTSGLSDAEIYSFDFAWIIDYLQPTEKQRDEWIAQFLQRDITRQDKARLRMHRKIHLVRDALFLAQSATCPHKCSFPKSLEGAFDLLSRKNFKGQLDLSDNNTKLSAVNRLIEEALKL